MRNVFILCLALAACTSDGDADVPDNAYCAHVSDWPRDMRDWEDRIFELVNDARAVGANCTPDDHYPPTHAYRRLPELTCASRVHSMDMHDRGFFDHTNPDGEGPSDRAANAGHTGSWVGENIVGGYGSPEAQFEGWMSSPGHCSAIMSDSHHYIGVGTYLGTSGYGQYTTATFTANP